MTDSKPEEVVTKPRKGYFVSMAATAAKAATNATDDSDKKDKSNG